MRRINRALPGPLIVVVAAIILSAVLDLQAQGVAIVGAVPAGLPRLAIPAVSTQDVFSLLPAALALTILIYADEILTARVFAARHGQKIDANQEFVALGMANIGAGFLTGFPAALSASRTTVTDQMGGKTQWVGIIAAALTIIFLLFLTPLLAPLPTVALGAIIIVASLGLIDIAAFRFLRQVRRRVLAGGGDRVRRAHRRHFAGHSRGGDAHPDQCPLSHLAAARCAVGRSGCERRHGLSRCADKETALTEPGLIVYRFDARWCFPQRRVLYRAPGRAYCQCRSRGLQCVILDAEAISDFDSTAAEALENSGCRPGATRY